MTFFTPRPEVSPDEMRLLPDTNRDIVSGSPAPPDRESPPITVIRAEDRLSRFEECASGRHHRCCAAAFTQRPSTDGLTITVRHERCDCRCHPVDSPPR